MLSIAGNRILSNLIAKEENCVNDNYAAFQITVMKNKLRMQFFCSVIPVPYIVLYRSWQSTCFFTFSHIRVRICRSKKQLHSLHIKLVRAKSTFTLVQHGIHFPGVIQIVGFCFELFVFHFMTFHNIPGVVPCRHRRRTERFLLSVFHWFQLRK